jgi:hypothetical protein
MVRQALVLLAGNTDARYLRSLLDMHPAGFKFHEIFTALRVIEGAQGYGNAEEILQAAIDCPKMLRWLR